MPTTPSNTVPNASDVQATNAEMDKLLKELNEINGVNRDITAELDKQIKKTNSLFGAKSKESVLLKDVKKLGRDVSADIERQIKLIGDLNKGLTTEKDIQKELSKNEKLLGSLRLKQNQQQYDLAQQQQLLAEAKKIEMEKEAALAAAIASGRGREVQKATASLKKSQDIVKSENDKVKALQNGIKITNDLIENYDEANDKLKKGVELFKKQEDKVKSIKSKTLSYIGNLTLFGVTLNSIWETWKKLEKTQTDAAQQLGLSVEQVKEIGNNTKAVYGNFTSSTFATSTLLKGLQELNAELGTSLDFSAQEVTQFTELTKTIGLSVTEATKLFALGKLNNQTLKQTEQTIVAGTVAANRQYGVQVSAKEVFKDISKLSAGILVKFQENPEAIAKAVVQAKALGTSLEQVDKIGDSLLNFESSIQNELEAQLVTGRQINLDKAREYALNNDSVGLMNELAKITGDLGGYNKLNRIQQESIAKAVGLSRDEVSQMLIDQAKFAALGDTANKSAAEQLKYAQEHNITLDQSIMKSLEQQAMTDKLDESFTAVKENLAAIVDGPLGGFAKMLVDILNSSLGIGAIITTMIGGGIAKIIMALPALIEGFTVLKETALGQAIASAWAAAMENPLTSLTFGAAGLALGAALVGAIISSMSSATSVKDAAIDSNGGLMISGPKGSFITDPADQIIAAPGAANLLGGGGGGITASQLDAIANRPVVVQANLTAGSDTIQKWQTNAGQYGSSGRFA
jgi:hypothetical protein